MFGAYCAEKIYRYGEKSFIALQNHHPGSKVQFRNIRIKA